VILLVKDNCTLLASRKRKTRVGRWFMSSHCDVMKILFANEICLLKRRVESSCLKSSMGIPREERRIIEAADRFPERKVAFRSAGVTGRDI